MFEKNKNRFSSSENFEGSLTFQEKKLSPLALQIRQPSWIFVNGSQNPTFQQFHFQWTHRCVLYAILEVFQYKGGNEIFLRGINIVLYYFSTFKAKKLVLKIEIMGLDPRSYEFLSSISMFEKKARTNFLLRRRSRDH